MLIAADRFHVVTARGGLLTLPLKRIDRVAMAVVSPSRLDPPSFHRQVGSRIT